MRRTRRGDVCSASASQGHDKVTAGDQRLLVRGCHNLARGERRQDRPETHDAAGPDDDDVDVVPGREVFERLVALHELRGGRRVDGAGNVLGQAHDRGSETASLFGQEIGVPSGRKRNDPVGRGQALENVERLSTDRAGRAEDGDTRPGVSGRTSRHRRPAPAPRTGRNPRGRGCRRDRG